MESEQNQNLIIGAYIKRNDPEMFLWAKKLKLNELTKGTKIGTCSRRRELTIKKN